MRLITGGLFQGQLEYALLLAGLDESQVVDGASCDYEDIMDAKLISNFHLLIKRRLEEELPVAEYVMDFIDKNSRADVIVDEIGCGVVPATAFDRLYRETTGRMSCELAKASDEVYRVFCGVATKIKG